MGEACLRYDLPGFVATWHAVTPIQPFAAMPTKLQQTLPTKGLVGCSQCGCPCCGHCGPLIKLLQESATTKLADTEAANQGETATVRILWQRCHEAEERVRRAEQLASELKTENNSLRQKMAARDDAATEGRRLKEGSAEEQALGKIVASALDLSLIHI